MHSVPDIPRAHPPVLSAPQCPSLISCFTTSSSTTLSNPAPSLENFVLLHPLTKQYSDVFSDTNKTHHSSASSPSVFPSHTFCALGPTFYFWSHHVPFHFSAPTQWSQSEDLSKTQHYTRTGFGALGKFRPTPATRSPRTPGPSWHPSGSHSRLLTAVHGYQSSPPSVELCSGSWPEQTLTREKKNVSPKQVGMRALSSFHQSLPQAKPFKNSQ